MKELILNMFESAKADRTKLIEMKVFAVKLQQYELASKLRELECELFPLSKEDKELKSRATDVAQALKMCELNATISTAFVLDATIKLLNEKGGEFSLKDAAKIISKKKELFATED